jgi:hypothetical protein
MMHFRRIILAGLAGLLALSLKAQPTQLLQIPGIPHKLHWENTPDRYNIQGNNLMLAAGGKTDMFRDPNVTYNTDNAPKLLFRPGGDFVLSAAIEHGFEQKWDGGALVLKSDSLHWIKFCFEKDYTGARRVVSVVTNNTSDDCNSVALSANKTWFKVAKAGKVITLYQSEDGKNWLLVRHLQFETTNDLEIGFLAQSPTGNACIVKFTDIQFQAKTIKDPYLGE